MKAYIVIHPLPYQFQEPWKHALLIHHLKCNLILSAVKEKKGDYDVECVWGILLHGVHE